MSFKLFLENPSYLRSLISDKLHGGFPKSFWREILHAPPRYFFESTFLGLIVLGIIIRSQATTATILGIILSGFIVWIWLTRENMKKEDKMASKSKDLTRLVRTMQRKRTIFDKSARSLLHYSPTLVKIFSSMYVFARFDDRTFQQVLIKANQLIRVSESVKTGVVLPNQYLDIAEQLQRDILNNVQSIIHSLPSTSVGDFRFETSMKILQEALEKIVSDIRLGADKQYEDMGPDIYNPPPSTRSGPWPNPVDSKNYDDHFAFYW